MSAILLFPGWSCTSDSTLEIRPRGSLAESSELAGLILRVRGRVLTATDFQPDRNGLLEARVGVPSSGTLTIYAALWQEGQQVAEGEVGWRMHQDWAWGLDIFRQTDDPMEMCFGCSGSVRIPIPAEFQNEPGEALWLTWGGKKKGSNIIF